MKSVVAVIDWYGPYDKENAQRAASDFDDGIYLALGKQAYEREVQMQYVGLASDLASRINGYHHKLPEITRDLEIWLGEVVSPRTPGRKIKVTDRMLDLSEWSHAYFLQLPLNQRKKTNPPDLPITVYNRWWKTDFETPRRHHPHGGWPDLIEYLGDGYDAKLVWFGGQQLVQPVGDFR